MDVKSGSKSVAVKAPSNDSAAMAARIELALENRRELLSRRPSYRKILKELGGSKTSGNAEQLAASDEDGEDGLSGEVASNGVANSAEQQVSNKLISAARQQTSMSAAVPQQQAAGAPVILVQQAFATGNNSQTTALRNSRSPNNGAPSSNSFEVQDASPDLTSLSHTQAQLSGAITSPHFVGLIPAGLNVVQMDGASQHLGTLLANATQPATILQYAQQGLDGQLYIPATANMQAYQMAAASANSTFGVGVSGTQQLFVTTATAPSVSTSASSTPPIGGHHGGNDSTRKREMRLLKNREAARECRRKKKEYVKCLENRVAVLESQNKTLIDELKALKELYCSKDAQPGGQSQANPQA